MCVCVSLVIAAPEVNGICVPTTCSLSDDADLAIAFGRINDHHYLAGGDCPSVGSHEKGTAGAQQRAMCTGKLVARRV